MREVTILRLQLAFQTVRFAEQASELLNTLNWVNIQIGNHVNRNFLQSRFISNGIKTSDPAAMRRQQFFFQAADRQHLTTQRSAGHCHIRAHRITGQG
ncbi:hypothetical protein KCP76_16060 [Salmonella enterica subsp. enterica serovar Weltevreden]|nr:hypothetical protein KCP76_16060 [Salmonella enterica subsp. enterica serovar Weltevreden]